MPGDAVSTEVRCRLEPEIAGASVLTGGSHVTGPTGSLTSVDCPNWFLAVTDARISIVRSPVLSVRLDASGPIGSHVTPSAERSHW